VSAIEDSAAALGLIPVWEESEIAPPEVYLWPENEELWGLFQACRTQWNIGMAGPTGLSYQGVEIVLRVHGIKPKRQRDVFSKIQVMERAMLSAWSEKKNG
jgi:hypothetical protein